MSRIPTAFSKLVLFSFLIFGPALAFISTAQAEPLRAPWCAQRGLCKCREVCTYNGRTTECRFVCRARSVATRSVRTAEHRTHQTHKPPLHGPGSSHNPIVYHPVHGPGSSHNPIVKVVRDHRRPTAGAIVHDHRQGSSGFDGDVHDHRTKHGGFQNGSGRGR